MLDKVTQRANYLFALVQGRGGNLELVQKAFQIASELHASQKRNDGSPYILHPIEVAIILAELSFDDNSICSALLHDTIEDCNYSAKQIEKNFNTTIAHMVDTVSAISNAHYVYDEKEIYEDPNFVKSSAEEQTFKKLIALGKKNPLGFCIKFADRLHNLRTIQTFAYPKQLEKVRETEKWVLPIAKALKAQYFYVQIKNECFKIINQQDGKNFFEHYNNYHNSNTNHIQNLQLALKELYSNEDYTNISIQNLTERKVFDELKKVNKNIKIKEISQGQLLKVPNYMIYLVYNSNQKSNNIKNTTLAKFHKNNCGLKIVDAQVGNFSAMPFFVVRDAFNNYFRMCILSSEQYSKLQVGTLDGKYVDLIDEENINSLDLDTIKVKTRSNEVKSIAKHSTVLDFAFKIHKQIGFAFKYAIINDSKTKFPPYTKLNDNDKVEIIVDKDENGNLKNNAVLRWLAYVNTEFAKKILIRYFEEM